ncbi:MAG TPA: hypothetical protein VMA73_13905 [Streptosporangiaceae bacterium]|nr:hypothetical protein [Streptosporangiaceae bacterium]
MSQRESQAVATGYLSGMGTNRKRVPGGGGLLVTGGGVGFAVASSLRPGTAARRQVRAPGQARTGNPPQRPGELANAQQPAATSTRATRQAAR